MTLQAVHVGDSAQTPHEPVRLLQELVQELSQSYPLGVWALHELTQGPMHLDLYAARQLAHAGDGLQSLPHGPDPPKLAVLHVEVHCNMQTVQAVAAAGKHPIHSSTRSTSTGNTSALLLAEGAIG